MRKLIVSLLALSLLVLPASAQSIRTASLGIGGNDVEDIGNITTFPQLSGLYANKVWFYSIDDGDDVYQTTILAELLGGTLGLQLTDLGSTNTAVNPGYVGATGYTVTDDIGNPWTTILSPDTVANVIYAIELGGGTAGVNLMYATATGTSTWDEEDTSAAVTYTDDWELENAASYLGVQLGYSLEEVGPMSRLDTAVGIGLPGYEMTFDNPVDSATLLTDPSALGVEETIEKDSGLDLSIDAQGIIEQSDDDSLRVQVSFNSSALETTQTYKVDGDDDGALDDGVVDTHDQYARVRSSNNMALKVVKNKKVNDGGLVILSTGFGRTSTSSEYTASDLKDPNSDGTYTLELDDSTLYEYSYLYIPVEMAVEDMINDNVTLRVGASKNILYVTNSNNVDDDYGVVAGVANTWGKNLIDTTENSSRGANSVTLAMGVGADFNNFSFNVETEADILVGGPYWITGDSSTFGVAAEAIYSY